MSLTSCWPGAVGAGALARRLGRTGSVVGLGGLGSVGTPGPGAQVVGAHEAGDTVLGDLMALAAELMSHPGTAVTAGMAMGADLLNGLEQDHLLAGAGPGLAAAGGVVTGAGNGEGITELGEGKWDRN
ncbi:MAG: hypothetical protein H7A47_03470 [Verrucomicrobiales bacterium]|nr:hypothetical protein [Verrucomicrobiales bacterium]